MVICSSLLGKLLRRRGNPLLMDNDDPWVDLRPSAVDPWQGQEPDEREDPGPSAVDRGPGLPMYNAKNGERMVEATEAQVADTVKRIRATDRGQGPIDAVDTTEADKLWKAAYPLPPEVLAQLQRIEDMLTKILEEGIPSRHTVRKVDWSNYG